ncbi:MAG TPA: molybdopterin dinucleotide binding domain-containing protein, partial [Methylomirabilota bacterium]|nr:molybdopterin dinucleotide binding domain-containing protein [Methylomirabilota bacterium]
LDVLYCLGGNFLRTLPEPGYVARALSNVPLRVHQDLILTDQMLLDPGEDVILLPARTRYEQEHGGTETTTERRILFSPQIPRTHNDLPEARSEWRILLDLAAAVHPDRAHLLHCDTGDAIRREIATIVPFYDGIQSLSKTGDQVQYGGAHLCVDGRCPTPDGRARFRVVPLPSASTSTAHRTTMETGAKASSFLLSTRRGKQFNTLIYDEIDPLTGAARDAVFMNPDDAARCHLKNQDPIVLSNELGRLEGRVFLAPIARGNLQVHWPEGNVLIRRGPVDPMGGVPDYNAVVQIEP